MWNSRVAKSGGCKVRIEIAHRPLRMEGLLDSVVVSIKSKRNAVIIVVLGGSLSTAYEKADSQVNL